jgi:FtsZ-binding cell division protein ZapB
MINLEQVKLLETKVAKAIDYVERLTKENTALHRQEAELQARLESYQKRIDELEVLVMRFKEDQGQIENGILAALDRLSQFEKAIEKSLKDKPSGAKAVAKEPVQPDAAAEPGTGDGQTCFEIPEAADEDDIPDPLENTEEKGPSANADSSPAEGGELLDIF